MTDSMGGLPLSDAPQRPKDAKKVLLDGDDDVYDHGLFRWRYSKGTLLRVIEYATRWPSVRIEKVWGK
jgi:hypothetical protein